MTTFQIALICILALFTLAVCWVAFKKGGITINYNKTITNVNKMDELQLEIARQNLAEIKKYNENASKQTLETSQAIRTMTTAVHELMGVNDGSEK